ncbi:carboxymuconolactone decarboxylase family protein [Jatrophihabitans telluris]|uniref:Carboxymuconolactone decarboxylase family protein n=1 Tax=Jatrophihabitans telluris TaxID=2038343 RepID=A0ABY4QWD8_9ACTN|nr:carboxymuconolactone decarboxylase family protein [Jatrophihabitans telluris]UQX87402.1 carboxymuconolactone decarboxylase family protein [Jatrophihabitans telluris]
MSSPGADASPDASPDARAPKARIPKLVPGALAEDQRAVYEAIAGGRRAQGPQLFRLRDDDGALEGPFNAFLLQPRLGAALQAVGSAVRYDTALSDRAREIAILVVAVQWSSAFEWYAHEAVGRHVGLSETELDGLAEGDYTVLPPQDRLVAEVCRRLSADADLDDATYADAVEALGEAGVFELLTLVGYYATLALQMRVFRVGSPAPTRLDTEHPQSR